MCDEYEQKTRRLEMLREKLKKIKEDQGEIAVSREFDSYDIHVQCKIAYPNLSNKTLLVP